MESIYHGDGSLINILPNQKQLKVVATDNRFTRGKKDHAQFFKLINNSPKNLLIHATNADIQKYILKQWLNRVRNTNDVYLQHSLKFTCLTSVRTLIYDWFKSGHITRNHHWDITVVKPFDIPMELPEHLIKLDLCPELMGNLIRMYNAPSGEHNYYTFKHHIFTGCPSVYKIARKHGLIGPGTIDFKEFVSSIRKLGLRSIEDLEKKPDYYGFIWP